MSRIGRMPIAVPAGVTVTIAEGNNVTVKGPLGTLTEKFNERMIIKLENNELTVSNFGMMSEIAEKSDIALGIINMVFETVGTLSVFASKNHNKCDIVLTGNLTVVPQAEPTFKNIGEMLKANFIIPKYSQYGTVIGAALLGR